MSFLLRLSCTFTMKRLHASLQVIQVGNSFSSSKSLAGLVFAFHFISMASFGSPVMASGLASLQVRIARTTEKIAFYESHLSFLTACADLSVIPKGMRLHFGTHALPKSDYLLQAVKDATNTASLQILSTCRDTYRVLITKERTALQHLMYAAYHSADYETSETSYRWYSEVRSWKAHAVQKEEETV